MKKSQFIIILLFLSTANFKAQDTLNSSFVESNSYKLYTEKNWTELIKFGNHAIEKEFDYYYLRIRLGIAYFESSNYYGAEKHFKKALSFNSDDELVLEYLYFCYIYTNHFEEAKKLSKSFSIRLSEKLKTKKNSPINFLMFEGGIRTTDSTRVLGNGNYFHFGLGHSVAKEFSLFHAITYFNQTFSDGGLVNGNYRLFQYFLKATVPLKNNWQISPGFHLLYKNALITSPTGSVVIPPPGFPPPRPNLKDTNEIATYLVGSLSVRKSVNHFDFSLGSTFSSVFDKNQIEHFTTISYSPLKKDKLILGLSSFIHSEDSYSNTYLALNPFLGINPTNKISLFGSYLYNQGGKNIIEGNGYIVNNSPDLTKARWSFLASVAVTKKIDIYGLYQFENKQKDPAPGQSTYIYHFNMFIIGLKIKP